MKKKSYLLFFLIIVFPFALLSQKSVLFDHVHLHGGSFLKGQITDTLKGGFIELKLQTDSVMIVPISYIKKVTKESKRILLFEDGNTAIGQGLYTRLSIQVMMGTGTSSGFFSINEDYRVNPSVAFAMGAYVHPWLAVGAGTSLDLYYDRRILPLFLESRLHSTKEPSSLYLGLQLGYGILLDKIDHSEVLQDGAKEKGGLYAYPAIGYRFSNRTGTDYFLDIGYKFQHYYYRLNYPEAWGTIREVVRSRYSSLTFRFSFVF